MKENILIFVVLAIFSILIAAMLGYLVRRHLWENQVQHAQVDAAHIIANAKAQVAAAKAEVKSQQQAAIAIKQGAENAKKAKLLAAQEEIRDYRQKVEDELTKQRGELARQENRLQQRGDTLDHKSGLLDERANHLSDKEDKLKDQQADLATKQQAAQDLIKQRQEKLMAVADLDPESAKKLVLANIADQLVKERAELIRNSNEEVKAMINKIVPMWKTSPNNKKITDNICAVVLIFPGIAAAMTWPRFSAKISRKPVTANSRQTMTATTQAGAKLSEIRKINAVIVNILSASGSANFPKFVTMLRERAI